MYDNVEQGDRLIFRQISNKGEGEEENIEYGFDNTEASGYWIYILRWGKGDYNTCKPSYDGKSITFEIYVLWKGVFTVTVNVAFADSNQTGEEEVFYRLDR